MSSSSSSSGYEDVFKAGVYLFGLVATGAAFFRLVVSVPLRIQAVSQDEEGLDWVLQLGKGKPVEQKEYLARKIRAAGLMVTLHQPRRGKEGDEYFLLGLKLGHKLNPSHQSSSMKPATDRDGMSISPSGERVRRIQILLEGITVEAEAEAETEAEAVEPTKGTKETGKETVKENPFLLFQATDEVATDLVSCTNTKALRDDARLFIASKATSSSSSSPPSSSSSSKWPPHPFLKDDVLMHKALASGLVVKSFPLHNDVERATLMRSWVKSFLAHQPLDLIRSYFNEEIGFYFCFLGLYSKWLVYLSMLGLLVFFYQMCFGEDNFMAAGYAVVATVWASAFLESWKRCEKEHAWKWNVFGCEEEERERLAFEGTRAFDAKEDRFRTSFTFMQRLKRFALSIPLLSLALVGVAVVMFSFFRLEAWATATITVANGWDERWMYLTNLPLLGYSIAVLFMDQSYVQLAQYLNTYENHRTESEHASALILKLVLFYFINNFGSLFYISFVLQDLKLLQQTLGSLLVTRQIVGNVTETLIPYLLTSSTLKATMGAQMIQEEESKKRRERKETKQTGESTLESHPETHEKKKEQAQEEQEEEQAGSCSSNSNSNSNSFSSNSNSGRAATDDEMAVVGEGKGRKTNKRAVLFVSKIEAERLLPAYEGTFQDFLELFVQFGQVSLFAAVYPLAPLCALANNLIEIRSDAFKLCMNVHRPHAKKISGIGSWLVAFQALGYIAVLTNCTLIGLMPGHFEYFFPDITPVGIILLIVGAEHFMILLKIALEVTVPDVPSYIREEMRREKYLLKKKQTKQEQQQHPLDQVKPDEANVVNFDALEKFSAAKIQKEKLMLQDEIEKLSNLYQAWVDKEKQEKQALQRKYQKT